MDFNISQLIKNPGENWHSLVFQCVLIFALCFYWYVKNRRAKKNGGTIREYLARIETNQTNMKKSLDNLSKRVSNLENKNKKGGK